MSSTASVRHAVAQHRMISVTVAILAATALALSLLFALSGGAAAGGSPGNGGGGGHSVPVAR